MWTGALAGLRAASRTAARLGMAPAWRRAQPALSLLVDRDLPVPADCRFWLWAGLDLPAAGRPVLKVYLSLHAGDVPGWRDRERAVLSACGVPARAPVHAVLDRLRADGWGQEIGIGISTGGRYGLKVYYELAGWRPDTVRDVLALSGLDADPTGLAPDVPGVLRAGLAAKRRAGIAVRVAPDTGAVDEVTVAAAFPRPLVGRDELGRRVTAWLTATGGCPEQHEAAVTRLLPGWAGAPPSPPGCTACSPAAAAGPASAPGTRPRSTCARGSRQRGTARVRVGEDQPPSTGWSGPPAAADHPGTVAMGLSYRDDTTAARAIAAGRAWMNRIRRFAVAAPYSPAMTTQLRKNTWTRKPVGSAAIRPHTRPAARKPL